MPRSIPSALLSLVLFSSLPANPALAETPGCTGGTAATAASQLVSPAAEVVSTGRAGGFMSALVLAPGVDPGVRHRLLRAGDVWCTTGAFNEAWRAAGRTGDATAVAGAYAQVAAAANFDGVTVRAAREIGPGVVTVDTHARTNGVTATWTVFVDAEGVRLARWVATGFAVRPFVAEVEGLTALPGLVRTYERTAAGTLAQREPLLPQADPAPEAITEGWTADDFLIRVSLSESGISPNAGQNIGVYEVDFLRLVRDHAVSNYNEFHTWGFRKGWTSNLGMIWIDNSTAATCLACVVRSATFNVHMSSRVLDALAALGFEYPDDSKALSTVIGHEMYHNWQNAYGKPDFNSRHSSFSEGTARMQETAHGYSDVTMQPTSLVYGTGRDFAGVVSVASNSCNGWDGADRNVTFANGPFTGKTYNACYFWLTWYGTHGPAGQVALLTAMKEAQKVAGDWPEMKAGIEAATGESILGDLAVFARASLTGHGYTWGPGAGGGTARDWGALLDRWTPPTLAPSTNATATIGNGGMVARKIEVGGYPKLTSNRSKTALAVVRSTSSGATEEVVASGACIEPPANGEQIWLVAIYPETGTASATLRIDPLATGENSCPIEEP